MKFASVLICSLFFAYAEASIFRKRSSLGSADDNSSVKKCTVKASPSASFKKSDDGVIKRSDCPESMFAMQYDAPVIEVTSKNAYNDQLQGKYAISNHLMARTETNFHANRCPTGSASLDRGECKSASVHLAREWKSMYPPGPDGQCVWCMDGKPGTETALSGGTVSFVKMYGDFCKLICKKDAAITKEKQIEGRIYADPMNDDLKCDASKSAFILKGAEATLGDKCMQKCSKDNNCVAFSGIEGSWCVGCTSDLTLFQEGALAYFKKTVTVPATTTALPGTTGKLNVAKVKEIVKAELKAQEAATTIAATTAAPTAPPAPTTTANVCASVEASYQAQLAAKDAEILKLQTLQTTRNQEVTGLKAKVEQLEATLRVSQMNQR